MARLRHNVVANFLGQGWTALIGVVFVPVYIRILGLEAYGLVGAYLSLQALVFVFDIGLSATLNRELARHTGTKSGSAAIHDLLRTLEVAFWPLCIAISAFVVVAAPLVATYWLQPVTLALDRVAHALVLMGLAIAAQWPASFYAGGLGGLERQITLNLANIVFGTARWVAVIPLLAWGSPTIEAFLYWQIGVSLAQSLTFRALLLRALPKPDQPPKFRASKLRDVRGFALGMFGIAVLSFTLVQADRIALSRILPLDQFGAYVLLTTVAAALSRVFNPFFSAVYPRLSRLVASGDQAALTALYHDSSQVLGVVVASATAMVVFFAGDLLRVWTHEATLATAGAPVLTVLCLGAALNGLMLMPYALQLAHGWTTLSLGQNVIAVFIVVPATWWLATAYGAIGAASAWLALNLGYVAIGVPLMHRRLLRGELGRWYCRDILPIAAAAAVGGFAMRLLFPVVPDDPSGVAMLAASGIAILLLCAVASPTLRALASRKLNGLGTA